jgi:hypothetical protein
VRLTQISQFNPNKGEATLPFLLYHMLRTKSLIVDIKEIRREWIFEHYLKLPMKLMGQDEMIKSAFNPKDTNPSMSIYFDRRTSTYRYKDFSADKGGDSVQLVQDLYNLSRGDAVRKVIMDYNQWTLNNEHTTDIKGYIVRAKYKLKSFEKRSWSTKDRYYWTKFKIGSKLLEKYNVFPLTNYVLLRSDEYGTDELVIDGLMIYGFFREDGRLYKIYQPMLKENKFLRIDSHIQGSEQLTYKKDYLAVNSSLKDVMALDVLNFNNVEAVAPDSESSLLPDSIMAAYKLKYKAIFVIFDNDDAGKRAMQKWAERFNVPGVLLTGFSKDLSDSVKDHGEDKVREVITPLIREAVGKYKLLHKT